jgi:hypothetical protein
MFVRTKSVRTAMAYQEHGFGAHGLVGGPVEEEGDRVGIRGTELDLQEPVDAAHVSDLRLARCLHNPGRRWEMVLRFDVGIQNVAKKSPKRRQNCRNVDKNRRNFAKTPKRRQKSQKFPPNNRCSKLSFLFY